MKTTQLEDNLVSVTAEKGYRLYFADKGVESAFSRGIMSADKVKDLVEIPASEVPLFSRAEHEEKVAELIRKRYSQNEELAIQRKAAAASLAGESDGAAIEEFNEYNAFVEQCKVDAKAILNQQARENAAWQRELMLAAAQESEAETPNTENAQEEGQE